MKRSFLSFAAPLLLATLAQPSHASVYGFTIAGPGVSGAIVLTYGTKTDSKTTSGYEVTGISGAFTDSTLGIVNSPITGLVPINNATPEPGNDLAPHDFSRFSVASGLSHGDTLSFDNLFYPGGSPGTATSYPFGGGFLDIYGLLFTIGNGDAVNVWSNGVPPGGSLDYGVAVVTPLKALDYVGGGVATAPTPEPGSLLLLGTGVVGVGVAVRRRLGF